MTCLPTIYTKRVCALLQYVPGSMQAATPKLVSKPRQPQGKTTAKGDEVRPLAAALPSPEGAVGARYPHQVSATSAAQCLVKTTF